MKPLFLKRLLPLGVILMAVGLSVSPTREKGQSPQQNTKPSLIKAWGRFPIDFIQNQGQADRRVDYYVKGRDKTLYFGPEGVTFSIAGRDRERKERNPLALREAAASLQPSTAGKRWNVRLEFEGIDKGVKPEGREKTGTNVSYFKGPKKDWKTGIPTYRSIAYRGLWPGVDLVYSGSMDVLKQDFVVRPGADPEKIKLAWVGPESVVVTDDGGMEIKTPLGGFRDERPVAYQVIGGEKRAVEVAYVLTTIGDRYRYGFHLGAYDRTQELVIDPLTFVYAGFIGGSGGDWGYGIAVDGSGNAYVTGATESAAETFPETVGPDLTYNLGTTDAFVAKVNSAGTALTYAGFIGGNGGDYGYAIAIDGSGNAYVAGQTSSAQNTFPETVGPDLIYNGGGDAFVAKVNSNGTGLDYAGFIGGATDDVAYGIAVDGSGNAYVVGSTDSMEDSFPVVGGPDPDGIQNGGYDAFVAKVAPDGSSLVYAGFIGGDMDDYGYGIAVDGSGNAYVTGNTVSTQTTFPVAVGPDLTQNGGGDGFVAKVNPAGTALIYSGFIGGSGSDVNYSAAVDGSGNAYVGGYTDSTEATFPETVGPDLTHNGGRNDVFVAKVKADGTGLDYAGYIGGSGDDYGWGRIAVDGDGNVYVAGYTASTETTFPDGDGFGTVTGPDLTQNGGYDAFVAKVNSAGTALSYAGFIGGSGDDYGYGTAIDGSGNAYVTGYTASTEATFPVTVGPDLFYNLGATDAFVAKIGIVAQCGDGVVEGSEACDDGNSSNTDACLTTCVAASCGDGNVRGGVEACDDGNTSNADACLNTCAVAFCGDGNVRTGTEACDDGNAVNTDACLKTCVAASCGDGQVQTGVDGCDDGNTTNGDGCSSACAVEEAASTTETTETDDTDDDAADTDSESGGDDDSGDDTDSTPGIVSVTASCALIVRP